jgi:hypothetical protein
LQRSGAGLEAVTVVVLVVTLASCSTGSASPSSAVTATSPAPTPSHSASATPQLVIQRTGYELAAPIQRAVAVWDGNVVDIAGGLDASGNTVGGVFSMNPVTGRLTSLGSLAQPVHDAAAAMIAGQLIVFAGGAGSSTDTVQAFDPATGAGAVIGRLPVALSDLGCVRIGPTTYLVGGFDGIRPRREIYATTDGRSFTTVGHLPVGLRYPAVTAVGDRVVIAGGLAADGPTTGVEVFDPASRRTTTIGDLPAPLAHAAAFTLARTVYVAGGRNAADRALTAVTAIDPVTGSVTPHRRLAAPVADAAVAAGSHIVLLIGGWGTTTLRDVLRAAVRPA